MDLTVGILMIFAVLCKDVFSAAINTYVGPDGRSYYNTTLGCSVASLYPTNPYNERTKTYTNRDDRQCCYYAETRNSCCMD
ncbi:unnamed protein product, partial [Candidula unifasciata]